jgi:hypothetical protein
MWDNLWARFLGVDSGTWLGEYQGSDLYFLFWGMLFTLFFACWRVMIGV